MKKISRTLLFSIIGITALLLMAFTPAFWPPSAASAATPTPAAGQQIDKRLSFALQREQNSLERQQLNLTRASRIAAKAQTLIDKAQAKGVDVTSLKNALADFNTKLASAQASHDQAASVLGAKNGFDASGNVTDRQAAHQTVLDARNDLRQAHLTRASAALSLRSAVLNWRIKNGKV
jgi:alpha-D-ribose 1-methylphosphonate 5-triphosphate diphosphatase PhnM